MMLKLRIEECLEINFECFGGRDRSRGEESSDLGRGNSMCISF